MLSVPGRLSHPFRILTVALAVLAGASPNVARAQSAATHIEAGDRERLDAAAALRHYEAAVTAEPNNFDALFKASRAAVDAGKATGDVNAGRALYKNAEQYARRAVAANPNEADGHFALAQALGRTAQTMGSRDKVKFAAEVRAHALEALRLNPKHDGALHIMGVWNAEVMRLSGIARFMAKNFLGGKVFDSANWDDAQRYLEEASAIAPQRLAHHLDLAEVYLDRNNKAKAREQLDFVLRAPVSEANDATFKREAETMMTRLR